MTYSKRRRCPPSQGERPQQSILLNQSLIGDSYVASRLLVNHIIGAMSCKTIFFRLILRETTLHYMVPQGFSEPSVLASKRQDFFSHKVGDVLSRSSLRPLFLPKIVLPNRGISVPRFAAKHTPPSPVPCVLEPNQERTERPTC